MRVDQDISQAPDPLDTVHVLKSDFDLLQAAATAAHEDYQLLVRLLGITPPAGKAPREVMYEMVIPTVAGLISEVNQVAEASRDIEGMIAAAKSRGGAEIDLGDGRKAVLAGKRIPGGLLEIPHLSRSDRRRIEREHRGR